MATLDASLAAFSIYLSSVRISHVMTDSDQNVSIVSISDGCNFSNNRHDATRHCLCLHFWVVRTGTNVQYLICILCISFAFCGSICKCQDIPFFMRINAYGMIYSFWYNIEHFISTMLSHFSSKPFPIKCDLKGLIVFQTPFN